MGPDVSNGRDTEPRDDGAPRPLAHSDFDTGRQGGGAW